MSKFVTARGRLTAYALACGYVEVRSTTDGWGTDGIRATLTRQHGVYLVCQRDRRTRRSSVPSAWAGFTDLRAARRAFDLCAGTRVVE